jgi:hypothetical protein
MSNHSLTDAERAERRQADRDRLEQAARALLTSEGWQRWVRVRSTNGLARYSFGNQLLIAMQRPDASYVAGFRAFLALNRCVRKGERAIRILAPMSMRNKDEEAGRHERSGESEPLPGTEPVPLSPPSQPIEGSTHAHLLAPLTQLAAELGFTVHPRRLDGSADGWCDEEKREIVINDALSANARVRVLVPWRSGRIRTWGMGDGEGRGDAGSTGGGAEPVGRSGVACRRARFVGHAGGGGWILR